MLEQPEPSDEQTYPFERLPVLVETLQALFERTPDSSPVEDVPYRLFEQLPVFL